MIIYNIRHNGPYEYEKFILNTFQLYNLVRDMKKKLAGHEIYSQLNTLTEESNRKTVPAAGAPVLLDRLLLLEKYRGNK